ncbi:hypothetical protein ACGC1H_000446 [Rhizoctonia solani]
MPLVLAMYKHYLARMFLPALSATLLLAPSVLGAVIWDGRFNDYSTATDFDKWSWSNQVGTYQTYIYGNLHGEKASAWYTLGSQYKNPATTTAKQGVKVKISANSIWNGGTMLRSELIPQTTASLSGHLYYHVSLQIPTVNPPNPNFEHQIVFWEGHYADIKYGQLSGQNGVADVLRVITGGQTIWSVTPVKGTWVCSSLHHRDALISFRSPSIISSSKLVHPAACGYPPAAMH